MPKGFGKKGQDRNIGINIPIKVVTEVTRDVTTREGRHIEVSIIKSNNRHFNNKIKLPLVLAKTFSPDTTIDNIKQYFITEIKSQVQSLKEQIREPNSLSGIKLEVTV